MKVWKYMEKDSSIIGMEESKTNKEDITDKEEDSFYTGAIELKLTRSYHLITHKEHLIVEPYVDTEPRGKIVCSFLKLDTELLSLFEHGVPFTRADANKVKRLINDNLLKIKRISIGEDEETQKMLNQVFDDCCAYISTHIDDVKVVLKKGTGDKATYSISVNDFNKIFEDCDVDMKLSLAKELLMSVGYTTSLHSNGVNSIKDADNKAIKGISFYQKKVDERNKQPIEVGVSNG